MNVNLFESFIHSIEGFIELSRHSLDLQVHVLEVIPGLGAGVRLVDCRQLVLGQPAPAPGDGMAVVAEGAHWTRAGQSRIHAAKLHSDKQLDKNLTEITPP